MTAHPDRLVSDFLDGKLSRRRLIASLMALGAAAAGLTRPAYARPDNDDDPPTFRARSIDHLALNVTDIPRSRDWYARHLGLRSYRETPTTCFLRCDGTDFLALFKADRPGMHHYSFAIPDYSQQTAAQRLREAGLTPKLRGRRTYFDDPDGIEVQVSQA